MKLLIFYYDGNEDKVKVIPDTEEINDLDRRGGFSADQFDLDEDCDINNVIELPDDAKYRVFSSEGSLVEVS